MSRSAFIRQSLESQIGGERLRELIVRERAGYAQKPLTKDERAAFRALSAAQDRAVSQLTRGDRW